MVDGLDLFEGTSDNFRRHLCIVLHPTAFMPGDYICMQVGVVVLLLIVSQFLWSIELTKIGNTPNRRVILLTRIFFQLVISDYYFSVKHYEKVQWNGYGQKIANYLYVVWNWHYFLCSRIMGRI